MQTARVQQPGVRAVSHEFPSHGTQERQSETIDCRDFSAVYRRYLSVSRRWLRAHGVPDWDTEDVAQEVFTVVYRKLDGFDGVNLGGWIYEVCKRTASHHRRRAWVRRTLLLRDDFSLEKMPNPMGSPATALATKERYRLVWNILSKMSAKQRAVFVLFEVEGYSGEEIAALEKIPLKTVWSRLARARKQFTELNVQLTATSPGGLE